MTRSLRGDNAKGRFQFYDADGPDLRDVRISEDLERAEIAQQADEWIRKLKWPQTENEPDKGQILLEALKNIYES